jgi:hypothetical protein
MKRYQVIGICLTLGFVAGYAAAPSVAKETVDSKPVAKKETTTKLTKEQEFAKKWAESDDKGKFNLVVEKHTGTAYTICEKVGKLSSKYPEKIDFKWSSNRSTTYWTDGNDVDRGEYTVIRSGEAMNGFGNMLPFNVECKFAVNIRGNDIHLKTAKWISGGRVTNIIDLPAPDVKKYEGKVYNPASPNA